jgi:uncharacterized protein YukE
MDPAVVQQVAREVSVCAQDVRASLRRLDSLVVQARRVWWGADLKRFESTWRSSARATLSRAGSDLDALAASLRRDAEQQLETSRASADGGGGAAGADGGSEPPTNLGLKWPWEDDDSPHEKVYSGTVADDSFDPLDNFQGSFGDCWMISAINGLSLNDTGDDILRSRVRWDEAAQGYWVKLLIDGVEEEIFVERVWDQGGGRKEEGWFWSIHKKANLISLFEAALGQRFGADVLTDPKTIGLAWTDMVTMVTGQPTHAMSLQDRADFAIEVDFGLTEGNAVVARTANLDQSGGLQSGWDPDTAQTVMASRESNGQLTEAVQLVGSHGYTVVGVDAQGNVGLMNPWGRDNPADSGGVFYISWDDFQDNFDGAVMVGES